MPYDINEPIQNKSLWILEESAVNSGDSFDKLKGELQVLWAIEDSADPSNEPNLYLKSPSEGIPTGEERTVTVIDHPRDMTRLRINSPGSYVHNAEFNPTKVSRISDSLIIPNFQIPLRLYGDPEKIYSDSHWEAILMGTPFKGETTERLIDMNSLFYDTALCIPLPYSIADINSSYGAGGYPASVTNCVQITNEYNHYSPSVKRYQEKVGTYTSETLIPSIYLFETIYCAPHVGDEEGTPTTYAALQAQLGTASMNRVTLVTPDTLNPIITAFGATEILQRSIITGSGAHHLHAWLDKMSSLTLSSYHEDAIMKQNKNFLFTNRFYTHRDSTIGIHGEMIAREFPYYNKIALTRHVGTSFQEVFTDAYPDGGSDGGAHSDGFAPLRAQYSSVLGQHFAARLQDLEADTIFLESLKNLALGEFSDFEMTEKSYQTFTLQEEFEGSSSTFKRYQAAAAKSQVYRQVDLLSFIAYATNNLTEAISNDTTTLGSIDYSDGLQAAWEAHTGTSSAARFASSGPLQELIPTAAQEIMEWSGWMAPYELAQWTYAAELHDGMSTGMLALQQDLYNVFFTPSPLGGYKEVIAYRIEKIGGSTTQDQTTATPIQNYWIFNSTAAPGELEFYDSQIKYGEEYTYNIYAYVITLAQRYKYTDFVISRKEQKIAANPEAVDLAARDERYYLSFFDPITQNRAPQTFFDGRGRAQNFAIERLVQLVPVGDQAQFDLFLENWFVAELDGAFTDIYSSSEPRSLFLNQELHPTTLSAGPPWAHPGAVPSLPTDIGSFRTRLLMYLYQFVQTSYNHHQDSQMSQFLEAIQSDAWINNSNYVSWSPTPQSTQELLTVAESIGINDSALSRLNEVATSAYELSPSPYLADCRVLVEPCLKLIEVPLHSKTLRLYDNPANGITINPFQYLDQSSKVGYDIGYDGFKVDMVYPNVISEEDMTVKADYLHAKDYITENIKESLSPQRYVEVYRIDHKPTKYSEFATGLVATIDLKIPNSKYCQVKTLFTNKIETNKKYYFLFRFVNELHMPGHLSQILETELINDGGYTYAKFGTLAEAEMETNDHIEVMSPFKKIIQITPSMAQLQLDDSNVDYTQAASQGLLDLKIGITSTTETSDSIWDDTFKIRLVSKKTGKKIDLNITYALTDEDVYTSVHSADPASSVG